MKAGDDTRFYYHCVAVRFIKITSKIKLTETSLKPVSKNKLVNYGCRIDVHMQSNRLLRSNRKST